MSTPSPRATVIIAAHNEAGVIGRCLQPVALAAMVRPLQIVVVANGCSDATADVASRVDGVEVTELEVASKTAALRAGDAAALASPRVYLDADVIVPPESLLRVLDRLEAGPALAARPPLRYDTALASAPVRRYYAARACVPSVMHSLWGAGFYALSAAGRARFDEFPDVTGDDLFIDGLFDRSEVEIVAADPVVVHVPRTGRDLVHVLRRVQRGRREAGGAQRSPGIGAELRHHAVHSPGAALEAATYAGFALAARRGPKRAAGGWERDNSSR